MKNTWVRIASLCVWIGLSTGCATGSTRWGETGPTPQPASTDVVSRALVRADQSGDGPLLPAYPAVPQ